MMPPERTWRSKAWFDDPDHVDLTVRHVREDDGGRYVEPITSLKAVSISWKTTP